MTQINRYHPLSGGKAVIRDLAVFPDTPQGEAALLAAANAGTLAVVTDVPVGARIGTPLAALSESRQDAAGVPFTKSVGATLNGFTVRLAPRLRGNHYPLSPQQAHFTTLLSRLPDVTVHPSKAIVWAGPYYSAAADRLILQKGFTHIAEATPHYGMLAGPGKKTINMEGGIFAVAASTAAGLPDSDPRKSWLQQFNVNQQLLPDDPAAGNLLGRKLIDLIFQSDQTIDGAEWITLDIENANANPRSSNGKDGQIWNALAYMYQGMIDAATEQGRVVPKPLLYDAGGICFQPLYYVDGMENGYPGYFSTSHMNAILSGGSTGGSILNNNHILAALVKANGGAMGMTSYQRFTWDNQTLFQKNPDGSFILDGNGNPLWRTDDRRTTIFGQDVPISGRLATGDSNLALRTNDALWSTTFAYMRLGTLTANMFFLNGGNHLPTNQPQAGWEKLQLQGWNRVDTEWTGGTTGQGTQEEYNKRPRNEDEIEFDAMMLYIFTRVMRNWMEHQPEIDMGTLVPSDLNSAKGGWEHIAKGIGRAAELNFLHDTTWRLLQPRYFMRRQETSDGSDPLEHYARKPIIVGGLVPNYGGKAYIWLGWRYVVQDVDKSTDLIIWAVNSDGSNATPGYKVIFDGRRGGLDYWQVPDAVANFAPTQWRFQFIDILGNKQTWTGDYRDATITVHPVPPVVLEAFAQPTTPVGGASALSFGTLTYDPATKKLKIPVSGAVGTVTYIIVGVGVYTSQPTDGFLLTDNAVGTEVTVRVHTDTQAEITSKITATATTTPPVTPSNSVNPMPEIMLGLFPLSTAPYRSQTTEQRSRFVDQYTVPVDQNDGIHIEGLSTPDKPRWIPAYIEEFADLRDEVDPNGDWGFYLAYKWSDFVVDVNGSASGAWVAHNLLPTWKQQVTKIMARAKARHLKVHVVFWPGRDTEALEYLPVSERAVDHNGQLTNAATDVPALYLYRDLKLAGFDVANINTTTSVGKYFSDLKDACHFLKPFQADGTLTGIGKGTHTNSELGWNTRQDNPASSWTDFSTVAIQRMQSGISALYGGNLAALNLDWGTSYTDFNQIQYNYTGDINDFKSKKGLALQKYGHLVLGDAIELMDRVVLSELPGILLNNQFGQPKGGQGPILRTIDIPYLLSRSWAVAAEVGQGAPVGLKYNPEPGDNHRAYASYAKGVAYQAAGTSRKVFVSEEESLENEGDDLSPAHLSGNMADTLSYGRTGRSGDGVGAALVLFSPKRWAGLQPDGVTGVDRLGQSIPASQSVKATLTQLASLNRRKTAATPFGTTDAAKTITVTMDEILDNISVITGTKFLQWQDTLLGDTQDVAWHIQGFDQL